MSHVQTVFASLAANRISCGTTCGAARFIWRSRLDGIHGRRGGDGGVREKREKIDGEFTVWLCVSSVPLDWTS